MPIPGQRWQEYVLPLGIIACLGVILVPLPPAIIDVLLAANITAAVIILLTTLYVRTPLELSIFPSLLLAATLARLVLNVATTRLILSRGASDHTGAAGSVIESFAYFVAGNEILVGAIIFLIIVVIQFVVITKGTTRISEVSARFALDSLPGRQMAVDADLASGAINQQQALQRREELARQSDFYGAMDGASKFVRGDAIAGLVITIINIVGGLIVGLTHGMSLPQAAETFTKLTIGDGLVSQIPALLVALSAGLLVTRSAQPLNLPLEFLRQTVASPKVLVITGSFLLLLIFTRLPALPLMLVGGGCMVAAFALARPKPEQAPATEPAAAAPPPIEKYLAIDPLEIELGIDLLQLADPQRDGDLLQRITNVRQRLAADLGIVLPKVRLRDNLQLAPGEYRFKVNNVPVANGTVVASQILAVVGDQLTEPIEGFRAIEPVTQRPAWWIDRWAGPAARAAGYRVYTPAEVLADHFHHQAVLHAADLLTRDATASLIEELRKTAPTTIEELVPKVLSLGQIQQVLQRLLSEGISIRPLAMILETLGDHAARTSNVIELVERVRQRMAATLSTRFRDEHGTLRVLRLDPAVEQLVSHHLRIADGEIRVDMNLRQTDRLCQSIHRGIAQLARNVPRPVLLVQSSIRPAIRQITERELPDLVILGEKEVTRDTQIEELGLVPQ